jgi:flagellar hook-length control protein FliK
MPVQRDVVTTVTTPPIRPLQSDVARQVIAEAIPATVPVESSAAQPAPTSVLPVVQATTDLLSIRTAVPAYAESAPSPVTTIATPVADVAWPEALGDRVASMANGNVRALQIRLNPAELGPLQVQIAMDDKQIEVTFNVSNALTREAIENSLPRLKDMLAEEGMSLAGASVDDQDGANRAADGGQENTPHIELHDEDGAAESQELSPEPATARGPKGLVDTFA